jgi:uncharacterized protein with ATP-grasp and redox domains
MAKNYPPPIISTQLGSWSHSTVKERFPEIARRVIEENQFPMQINDRLVQLREEIPHQPIRHLLDQGAPDQADWRQYIQPFLGRDWLSVPWFFAEMYFYRRIIEAVDYFNLHQDPFGYQKQQGLEKSVEDINALTGFLADRLEDQNKVENTLRDGFYFSLWGNQSDLSLWPAGSAQDPRHSSRALLQKHLLANDIKQVLRIFSRSDLPVSQVDLLLDNAGFEFVSDLALADILLSHHLADRVNLHVKTHPTFVSDVIEADLEQTIQYLIDFQEDQTAQFGKRLQRLIGEERIQTKPHLFWNSPLPLWELPGDLKQCLKTSSLLVSKGDANYRRILGDREWDFTEAFHRAVDYLPVPLVALRTLKAELAVGLDLDQIQTVFNQDPHWLTDGKWGVIHYAPGRNMGKE